MRWLCGFALLLSCSSDGGGDETFFVGTLRDGDVVAASVWRDEGVLLYSCGRDGTLASTTAWISGSPDGDARFVAADGPVNVNVVRAGSMVSGELTDADGSESIALLPADDATAALFLNLEGPCRTAAIILREGDGFRTQGAHFCDPDGPFFQVTPVRPLPDLPAELEVSFDDGTGEQRVMLDRVER
ncbi:MAG: hypothetical protein AAGE52_40045 [Myxococcota bacterium]